VDVAQDENCLNSIHDKNIEQGCEGTSDLALDLSNAGIGGTSARLNEDTFVAGASTIKKESRPPYAKEMVNRGNFIL